LLCAQVINMLSVYFACGPDSEQFRKHVARMDDYLWVAEDGMKMQVRAAAAAAAARERDGDEKAAVAANICGR
jgi:hypothetical protein